MTVDYSTGQDSACSHRVHQQSMSWASQIPVHISHYNMYICDVPS